MMGAVRRGSTTLLRCAFLAALLAVCCSASTALAQGEGGASEAERLFKEGVEAAQAGDHATACAKFGKSLELVTRASTLINMALCEEQQGKLASALKRYKTGVALLPADDERLESAANSIEALSRRVPRLSVELGAAVPNTARVLIDGAEVARGELEMVPLDPGEHQVVLAVSGHRDASHRVQLAEGERKTATLSPGPIIPVRDDKPDPQAAGTSPLLIGGIVAGSIGVAGIIVGVATGAMTLERASTVEDPAHCDADLACDQEGVDAAKEGETLAMVSTVGFVAGGVLLAGGVALTLVGAGVFDQEGASVALRPSRAGLGVELEGAF